MLDVSTLGVGQFDYITCLGVLHHLPSPVEGLKALESVLADGGAMAIMVYGSVGRSHIYAMQNILRHLTASLDDPGEQLAFSRKIVANLPPTNGFRMAEGTEVIQKEYLYDDINFWDTLLHEQDCSYTASEVRELLATSGLFVQTFASYQGKPAITGLQYDLNFYITDASHLERLKELTLAERENLAEALDGKLALHTVYATRTPQSSLNPMAPNAILSPMSHSAQRIIAYLEKSGQGLSIVLSNGQTIHYKPSVVTLTFLGSIDGNKSNSELFNALDIKENSDAFAVICQELRVPIALHWVVARTNLGSFMPPLADIYPLSIHLRHYEPINLPI